MNKKSLLVIVLFALCAFIDTKFALIESIGLNDATENLIKFSGALVGFVLVAATTNKSEEPAEE